MLTNIMRGSRGHFVNKVSNVVRACLVLPFSEKKMSLWHYAVEYALVVLSIHARSTLSKNHILSCHPQQHYIQRYDVQRLKN